MLRNARAIFFISIGIFLAGCSASPKEASKNEKFIAAYVPPFYYFGGPEINVGEYSDDLARDLPQFGRVIRKMESNKMTLRPEQMYVASIRLYELGENETAILWFYRAFYRARLFTELVESGKKTNTMASALKDTYLGFHQQVGPFLNGVAGCDTDRWIDVINQVIQENAELPDMNILYGDKIRFIPDEHWHDKNQEVASSMKDLIQGLESLRPSWQEMRDSNGLNQRHCR